jgi:hypothetical protein
MINFKYLIRHFDSDASRYLRDAHKRAQKAVPVESDFGLFVLENALETHAQEVHYFGRNAAAFERRE